MSDSRQKKVLDALRFYENYGLGKDFNCLMRAICHTCLGDYGQAQYHYGAALQKAFGHQPLWLGTSQPDWLVHMYVMANTPSSYAETRAVFERNKPTSPWKDALHGIYSDAMFRLIEGRDGEAMQLTPRLLARPKYKDSFAMGKTIAAIVERDQGALDDALSLLLTAHRGMAKFGALRETAEGFLCLSAMSLAKMALDRGMVVNTDSEYVSMGYLEYLLTNARGALCSDPD
jgi:hypothetical protein